MRRWQTMAARLALTGLIAISLGTVMVVGALVHGSGTPAFADSSAYELYCPGTPVGNIVLNGVVTTGTITPPAPTVGEQFSVTDYSSTVTLPSSIVGAAAALGNSVIAGTAATQIDATGATPASIPTGDIPIDAPIPSPVPSTGLALTLPPTPATIGPFTASGGAITVTVDRAITLSLVVSGSDLDLTCTPYPNNAAATGIVASAPPGSPASPVIATATSSTATTPPSTTTVSPTSDAGPYYLAVGDSVPVWDGSDSYPYQIASHYAAAVPDLHVVDMACSGETTGSMISNSLCPSGPTGSQLQEATGFLQAHQGSVAFITIDIGGNDVVNCVNGAGIDTGCVLQGLTIMQANMKIILSALRQAAGPTVPIYAMNYFNPFLGDWVAGGSGQTFAVSSVAELQLFNQVLEGAYAGEDVPVADVADAFESNDLTDLVSSPWGQVPVAVDKACTLLDITCTVGQLEGFGDDPNAAGATVIAGAFETTMGTDPTTITTTTTTTTTAPTTTTTGTTETTPTSTANATTTTSTTSPTSSSGSGTSPSSGVVTAPSRSLAFTGASEGVRVTALVGLVLIVLGGALLALVDGPRRVIARCARPVSSHDGGSSGTGHGGNGTGDGNRPGITDLWVGHP